ncbi:MAG: FAS1-like dehydratase domain-containing protein [Solirubrobacterales bacterium]
MGDADEVVGRTYPPHTYEVGREKIREYAQAVNESDRIHYEHDAAQAAGFRAVVAPPMFAVVYSGGALGPAILDPELGIDFSKLVHGAQEFTWGEPVCAGDTITTTVEFTERFDKGDNAFYLFTSRSENQDGQQVSEGTWTNIIRGAAAKGDSDE